MKVMDPGHLFVLNHLDGEGTSLLRFVKRVGDKFPGNEPPGYGGTTVQEVIRALISRIKYVDNQEPSLYNEDVIDDLRRALNTLECRAAFKNNRLTQYTEYAYHYDGYVEDMPVCKTCGHIACVVHDSI